jgi:hypothetical protein
MLRRRSGCHGPRHHCRDRRQARSLNPRYSKNKRTNVLSFQLQPLLLLLLLLLILFSDNNNNHGLASAAVSSSTREDVSSETTTQHVGLSEEASSETTATDGDFSYHNPDHSEALSSCASTSKEEEEEDDEADSKKLSTPTTHSTTTHTTTHAIPDCHVYMAASTLGGNTNLGMYTSKPLHVNDIVKYPEIVIPLQFRDWGEPPPYRANHGGGDGTLWDRYIWEGDIVPTMESYDDHDRSTAKAVFIPGLGCTVNSLLEMANIQSAGQGSIYDTAGLHRTVDPGSGAFSPYHHAVTRAIQEIPAGSELLASYGSSWIPWIPGVAVTQQATLDDADDFLDEYWEWVQQIQVKYNHGNDNNENDDDSGQLLVSESLKEALWKLTSNNFPIKSRVFSVLPRTADWKTIEAKLVERDLVKKQKETTTTQPTQQQQQVPSIPRDFIRAGTMRTVEWLQQHGKCQDHLRPGQSTIPQAGRGAFAARDLPRGTIVGYAPLIHIGETALDLWTMTYNPKTTKQQQQQPGRGGPQNQSLSYQKLDLILNYSFGHANSTLILTPYGAMVNYINHDQQRVNVKVTWPDPTQELVAHKPEWLQQDVTFLKNTIDKIGLSLEYVALRDIEEGEEILMDYGTAWQAAWDHHVATWTPPPDAERYVHSSQFLPVEYFRTQHELQSKPYPPNLHTMCSESYRKSDSTGTYQFVPVLRPNPRRVYCTVLMRKQELQDDRDEGDAVYTYTVQLELSTEGGSDESTIVVHGMTTDGLFLYDKAYTNDWHLQNAFRHTMMIPDEIFPESWKNL